MVFSGVASFRLLIGESALTYQYRSPVPVKAGARMRTGAPLENARITPATPTPGADIGAAGNDRLHGLAGARGADILQHQAVLLEDAGILAERRGLVFPVVDLADRDLELVLGRCRWLASASGTISPSAPIIVLNVFIRSSLYFLHFEVVPTTFCEFENRSRCRRRHSTPRPAHWGSPKVSPPLALGLPLARLRGLSLLRYALAARIRPIWPPASTSIPTSA